MIKSPFSAIKSILFGSFIMKFFSFFSSIIMARLLAKEDFGLWVVVIIITSFVELVFNVGFEYYYVVEVDINDKSENKTPDKKRLEIENTVFFLKALFGILLFIVQFSSSYFLDGFYFNSESSSIDELIRLTSFSYLIAPFGVINEVRFRKAQDFKYIIRSQIYGEGTNIIAKVSLAFFGFGAFSIAYGSLSKTIVNAIYISVKGKFLPNFKSFKRKYIKEILWFAKHSWISGFFLYLTQQIDKIVLKSLYSLDQIGSYNFGSSTAQIPVNYLIAPQNNLIMSYVSNYKNETKRITDGFSRLTKLNFLIVFPIAFVLYELGEQIIPLIYGEKWLTSLGIFKAFLIFCMVRSFCSPYMPVFTAMKKIKFNTYFVFVQFIAIGIALYLGYLQKVEIETYSWIFVLVSSFFQILKSYISLQYLGVSLMGLFKNLQRALLFSILSFLIYYFMTEYMYVDKIIACSIFFVLSSIIVMRESKNDIFRILKKES